MIVINEMSKNLACVNIMKGIVAALNYKSKVQYLSKRIENYSHTNKKTGYIAVPGLRENYLLKNY